LSPKSASNELGASAGRSRSPTKVLIRSMSDHDSDQPKVVRFIASYSTVATQQKRIPIELNTLSYVNKLIIHS
jgi:hypothetical protein